MESAGFMNALTSAASAAPVRKRKRVTTVAKVLLSLCIAWIYVMYQLMNYMIVLIAQ